MGNVKDYVHFRSVDNIKSDKTQLNGTPRIINVVHKEHFQRRYSFGCSMFGSSMDRYFLRLGAPSFEEEVAFLFVPPLMSGDNLMPFFPDDLES